jgi:hypothetical protein
VTSSDALTSLGVSPYLVLVTIKASHHVGRNRLHRYRCSRCKDLLRVKVKAKGQSGVTEQCPACHPKQTSAAGKAELILDSLMLPGLPKRSASTAVFRGMLGTKS